MEAAYLVRHLSAQVHALQSLATLGEGAWLWSSRLLSVLTSPGTQT